MSRLMEAIAKARKTGGMGGALCCHAEPCAGCGHKATCRHPTNEGEVTSMRNCSSDLFCRFYAMMPGPPAT